MDPMLIPHGFPDFQGYEVYFWGLQGGSQCTCVAEVHTAPGEESHLECQPGTEGFLLARSLSTGTKIPVGT